ncbi:MAG: AAA family ATPase [Gemmatimonadota bacterium]|uniref:shikimate kinase n=1 Tax=Candidatus Palauibacter scopulicola TaxID=3056741 RepID=UPI0023A56AC8|nr:shikimate kinase [Candidatus Palauibacter scopulicola]MDE2663172.1 AAA family ATPase [Candidatus Palauibacter scopulicola]
MAGVPGKIWLVGLSGSGKSTMGPILARRLGYRFVDLDREIEARAGESISRVFRRRGEGEFRRLEAAAAARVAREKDVVVATGGGWMARRDIDRSSDGRVRVWLRVRPETAIHRLSQEGAEVRPLLAGPDPEAALAALLAAREAAYAEAEVVLETDGREPEDVVEVALRSLRHFAAGRQGGREGPTEGPTEGQQES